MAPLTCDKKRAQLLTENLNRSVEKLRKFAEEADVLQDTQFMATSPLPRIPSFKRSSESQVTVVDNDEFNSSEEKDSDVQSSKLMTKARVLLNIVRPYLKEMEIECQGTGTGFLALISDGEFRAMWGERIYTNFDVQSRTISTTLDNAINTSAARTAGSQSHEDRRVMIRPTKDHQARKEEPLTIRKQIQKLIPDPSLVSDAWQVLSGIALLAPTPAKAAILLKCGNAVVERQESWATFIIGYLLKRTTIMEREKDTLDDLLLQEPGLARIRDEVPIRLVAWTKRSADSTDLTGEIRLHIPGHKAHRFPSRLQLFGNALGIQRIRDRKPVPTCEKCHGFHSTRTCAR
ncbi:hypothetical protein EPUL_002048 [Erysiphe pulchra]|uniref:Uncharacterized protein n=1 Tax=Erysiphe pulchra TaxID=225359 RepID=A0A2S4PR83_9PEZI|nr:hypothetical protein EPUL_002048 [Erysiphe pulchra]